MTVPDCPVCHYPADWIGYRQAHVCLTLTCPQYDTTVAYGSISPARLSGSAS